MYRKETKVMKSGKPSPAEKAVVHRKALLVRIATMCDVLNVGVPAQLESSNLTALESALSELKRARRRGGIVPAAPNGGLMLAYLGPNAGLVRVFGGESTSSERISEPQVVTEVAPGRAQMLAACVIAIRAHKILGAAGSKLSKLSDEDLTADLNRITRGRNCKPSSAVSYYRQAITKAA
jgi:hypothetical protein